MRYILATVELWSLMVQRKISAYLRGTLEREQPVAAGALLLGEGRVQRTVHAAHLSFQFGHSYCLHCCLSRVQTCTNNRSCPNQSVQPFQVLFLCIASPAHCSIRDNAGDD